MPVGKRNHENIPTNIKIAVQRACRTYRVAQLAKLGFNHPSVVLTADLFIFSTCNAHRKVVGIPLQPYGIC